MKRRDQMDLIFIQERDEVFGVVVADVVNPYGGAFHVELIGRSVASNDAVHLRERGGGEGGGEKGEGERGGMVNGVWCCVKSVLCGGVVWCVVCCSVVWCMVVWCVVCCSVL